MINRQKVNLVNLVGHALGGQHGDFLRTALSAVLHAMMDAQVDVACGAGWEGRACDRPNRHGENPGVLASSNCAYIGAGTVETGGQFANCAGCGAH